MGSSGPSATTGGHNWALPGHCLTGIVGCLVWQMDVLPILKINCDKKETFNTAVRSENSNLEHKLHPPGRPRLHGSRPVPANIQCFPTEPPLNSGSTAIWGRTAVLLKGPGHKRSPLTVPHAELGAVLLREVLTAAQQQGTTLPGPHARSHPEYSSQSHTGGLLGRPGSVKSGDEGQPNNQKASDSKQRDLLSECQQMSQKLVLEH